MCWLVGSVLMFAASLLVLSDSERQQPYRRSPFG
jgi:hypothetical protein